MSRLYGGAVSKKLKKYARIIDYIEVNHPKYYQIINDLGMFGSFTPSRGAGITVLLPDAKLLKKIEDITYSDDPEPATDIIGSMVIVDLYKTPKDFSAKGDDVPNKLGEKIEVEKVGADSVTFKGGAVAKVDSKFKPLSRQGSMTRDNMAVWNLTGEISTGGAKATFKHLKKGGKSKKVVKGGSTGTATRKLTAQLEDSWLRNISKGGPNPYVKAMATMYDRLSKIGGEDAKSAKEAIEYFWNPNPMLTYYSVVQPHTDKERFLSNHLVENLSHAILGGVIDKPVSAWKSIPENVPAEKRADMKRAVDNIRSRLLRNVSTVMPVRGGKVYDTLSTHNKLGGVEEFYPTSVHNVLKKEKDLLPAMHYFSWAGQNSLDNIMSEPERFRAREAGAFLSDIRTSFSFRNPSSQVSYKAKKIGGSLLSTPLFYSGPVAFTRSSDFLRTPKSCSEIEGEGEYDEEDALNPHEKSYINVDQKRLAELEKERDEEFKPSESAMEELKYYASHGGDLSKLK